MLDVVGGVVECYCVGVGEGEGYCGEYCCDYLE